MRKLALVVPVALAALVGASCADSFTGTTLVFEFEGLPSLHRVDPADAWSADNPSGELCADDAYAAAHPDAVDDLGVNFQRPFKYRAWATINQAPVLLAEFTVRECTVNYNDTVVKPAVTSVSYAREPKYGYPTGGSEWYGVVNAVINSVPSGGATIATDVRLDQATEIFVTRDDASAAADAMPGTVLMQGDLRRENLVYSATLAKVSGRAFGLVTAIPADRGSAW